VAMHMQFTPTSWVLPFSDIISFRPSRFEFQGFVLYALVFVWMVGVESLQIFEMGPRRYMQNVSNFLDLWIASTILVVLLTQVYVHATVSGSIADFRDTHLANATMHEDVTQFATMLWGEDFWDLGSRGPPWDEHYILIFVVKAQKIFASITVLFAGLRLITLGKTFPIFGPIVYGIAELFIQPTVKTFLCIYTVLFLSFGMGFFMLSADSGFLDFRDLITAFISMIRGGMLGDIDYGELEGVDWFMGPLFYLLFIFMSQIVMTNLFIAIVSAEYDKASEIGQNKWKLSTGELMAKEFVNSLPRDSSGQIDLQSSPLIIGHNVTHNTETA